MANLFTGHKYNLTLNGISNFTYFNINNTSGVTTTVSYFTYNYNCTDTDVAVPYSASQNAITFSNLPTNIASKDITVSITPLFGDDKHAGYTVGNNYTLVQTATLNNLSNVTIWSNEKATLSYSFTQIPYNTAVSYFCTPSNDSYLKTFSETGKYVFVTQNLTDIWPASLRTSVTLTALGAASSSERSSKSATVLIKNAVTAINATGTREVFAGNSIDVTYTLSTYYSGNPFTTEVTSAFITTTSLTLTQGAGKYTVKAPTSAAAGTVTLRLTSNSAKTAITKDVTITIKASDLSVSAATTYANGGADIDITASWTGGVSNYSLTSSNSADRFVDNGTVTSTNSISGITTKTGVKLRTAAAAGTRTITLTANNGQTATTDTITTNDITFTIA